MSDQAVTVPVMKKPKKSSDDTVIHIRVPIDMHQQLKALAEQADRKLSDFVRLHLREWLAKKK